MLFVELVAQIDLRPDAAHQQAVVIPHEVFGDVDVLVAEVLQFRPVFVVVGHVADLHFVDEGVLPLVLEQRLGFIRLVGTDEVGRQGVVDHLQTGVDGDGIIGGAVFPQQVLQDEDRDVGSHLHLAHQVLADHLARKHGCRFSVQFRHG